MLLFGYPLMRKLTILKGIVKSFIGVASGVLASFGFFALAARSLGPHEFGVFALLFAKVQILTIFIDFGQSQKILFSHHLYKISHMGIPQEIFWSKIILIALSIIILLIFMLIDGNISTYAFLGVGACAYSFGLIFSFTLKADNQIGVDAKNSFMFSLFLISGSGCIFVLGVGTVETFSAMYCIGQIFQLLLNWLSFRKACYISKNRVTFKSVILYLTESIVFAFDVFVVRAYGFIDVIILGFFTNYATIGLYQAGQKILSGALAPSQAINNVVLPAITRRKSDQDNVRKIVLFGISIFGFAISAPLFLFGDFIVIIVFGEEYRALGGYTILLGCLVVLKYIAFSLAIILTASGMQANRLRANLFTSVMFCCAGTCLSYYFAMDVMLYALVGSTALQCGVYWYTGRRC